MKKKRYRVYGWMLIILGSVLYACYYYTSDIQDSLWTQNVEQALEITSQGGHAFEVYISIERDRVHSLASDMSKKNSNDADAIIADLRILGGETSNYTVVDLEHGMLYSNRLDTSRQLDEEELAFYHTFSESGLRENYINEYNGQNTLGIYEHFSFADGTDGLIQKGELISKLSKEFIFSFYNERGFSYIINGEGDILIRPRHRNSNRTFLNVFDIIIEENGKEEVEEFRESLEKKHSGVVQFSFNGT